MISFRNCNNKIRKLALISAITSPLAFSPHVYAEVAQDQLGTHSSEDKVALTEQFNQTFSKMMDDPADIELTTNYANLAIKLENYEAAIPALERILLFNPALPRVKQQLGVMYFKLDSFEMAKSYLLDSKKGSDVPEDVIQKADEYLAKIK